LVEACVGLLDSQDPEACIKRETEEERGYRITEVQKVFEAYMSTFLLGSITTFHEGGGLESEQEEIEVIELPFAEAYDMIASGEIKDAKTIMLLK
jgi:GDP-mannose pyrophosphatase NudK